MSSILVSFLFFIGLLLFLSSGSHLFPLLLFLDVLMLVLLLSASWSPYSFFILILLLCVLSASLGMVILISSVRNIGSDNIFSFW